MAYKQPIPVRFRDIDALNHVNHVVYLTYAETIRCAYFLKELGAKSMGDLGFIIARVECDYLAPVMAADDIEIVMWTSRMGGKSWDFTYRIQNTAGKIFAEVVTVQVAFDYGAGKTMDIIPAHREKLQQLTAP